VEAGVKGLKYKLVGKLVVPCTNIVEWGLAFENGNRQVGRSQIGPLTVSTVFLGLDHGWGGKSLFFETKIFGDRDRMLEINGRKRLFRSEMPYTARYETWDEAEKGHKAACRWAQMQLDKLDFTLNADLARRD
jgi:hypothetical protein